METKQEYQEVLNRMEEAYFSSDNSMGAMSRFKEDVNLLYGLVNEHFKEKVETNLEHYKDGIIELCVDDLAISNGKVAECGVISCSECDFADKNGHCIGSHEIINRLKQPYKKSPYKLTKFENDLLQSYLGTYKFKEVRPLTWMKEKGHFKGVDENEIIGDILANCEVSER